MGGSHREVPVFVRHEAALIHVPGQNPIEVLQYVRDVTVREDAQRLRAGTSAQVVAAVRNIAVAALRLAGFTGAAAGRRRAARNPARPLAALNLMKQE
jgi:hypothetical protein